MPVTTVAQEYARLRSYLNPFIRGPNVDAVLTALATGSSSYLVNSVAAVNENLYITTAIGQYLDLRLADYGIERPSNIGLSDDVFREIGIQVKNRKQVRDLINNLLDAIFGDQFVKANSNASQVEPYNLTDGDTLIINFDENTTTTVIFGASQFESIAAAKAQEVADAISTYLSNLGVAGAAIVANNGTGNYVKLISNTIGPASSVTVMGGSAQNAFQFPSIVPAGGNMSTQWTISLQAGGGLVRFTWTGGANPQLGKVESGNYVNIFGGGFTSSPNEGSYVIVTSVGGIVDQSYFEVENPSGSPGIVVQGTDTAVLFYNPIKETLLSQSSYAAVYQTQARMLQIFIPATTVVIRRGREGSAHVHYPPYGTFIFNANPSPGDIFSITSSNNYVAGIDFVIGATIYETVANLAAVINEVSGLVADADIKVITNIPVLVVQSTSASVILTITYTGSASIVASGLQGDYTSLVPNQPGPYVYDTTQPFVVSAIGTKLTQEIDASKPHIAFVNNSNGFPNSSGYLIFEYGTENQEGPVPYISVPSDDTLLISPAYTIQIPHAAGATINLIGQKAPVSLASDGSDYEFFVTDVASGRIYAQDLINSISAAGINIVFTILYPGDIGLGKWGTIYSEISYIYGP